MKRLLPLLLLAGCTAAPVSGPPSPVSGDPRRPAAVTTEGVPAIPDAVHDSLRLYQNARSASFLDWAPDGTGMLIATRFGNTTQLHRVLQPDGDRRQLTFFDEPVGYGRFWPDGAIYFTSAAGGNEQHQVYRLDPESGKTTLLTDGKSRHGFGPINRMGTWAVLGVCAPGARDTDLFLFDPARPAERQLLKAAKGQDWSAIDFSPDGTKVLISREVSVNESHLELIDVATKAVTPIPDAGNAKAAHGPCRFSADGQSLLLTSDSNGEFRQLALVSIEGLKWSWLTRDIPWDIEEIEPSPDGSSVAFSANENGISQLYLADERGRREIKLPPGVIGGLKWSHDGARLGFTFSRADAPSDAYSVDLSGKVARWTTSELGGIDPGRLFMPGQVSVTSFDGTMISGWCYLPSMPGRKAPVIVNIHGGPEGQARPTFSSSIQYWVGQLNCAVLVPNVRGSTGYGKTFVALDNGEKREDSVRDIGAFLDWIEKQPGLDASRVAVIGGSYGGYMVLGSLANHGARIRAGVDIVGIANFTTFLEKTSAYRRDLRRVEYGDERDPKMREVFERISPARHADRIKSALMVVHGRNDPRVPFAEAEQIAREVRAAGRTVWTVFAENEGHGFEKKENRDYMSEAITVFFKEMLLK